MLVALVMVATATAAPTSMAMPDFLAGCWEERRADQAWTEECWTSARGGLMIGSGRDGKGNAVRHWEWMRIERSADGAVVFYGSPKGAPAVPFKASASNANSIIFENAVHDYPQRVSYTLTADGLTAELSLADGSKPNRWRYRRPDNR